METSSVGGTLLGLGVAALVFYLVGLLIAGLIVGALARLALPGPDPMSWLATMGYGVAGSFIGGIVGRMLGLANLGGFLLGIACAAGLIWYFRRRGKPPASGSPPPPPAT
jgi:uncharacterized membrane protein YeaQ/YmgE (transglycosylase-associated protein family)